MKKLLSIMTLCLCSFFFIFNEEVNAEDVFEVNYSIDAETYINEDFYKLQKLAKEYATNNGLYYFIFGTSLYMTSSSELTSKGRTWFEFTYNGFICSYDLDTVSVTSCTQEQELNFAQSSTQLYKLLDSSVIFYYSPYELSINYKDLSYSVNSTNKVPTLYEIYLEENNIVPTDPHQEEINKINNFYTIVIEKIGYLADQIATNYILLFTIGIFILIFTFLLIFRRFL